MNKAVNQHGLRRDIRAHIKREVRQNSKFGCVVCRAGIFEYEHIDPEFRDAKIHASDAICCLCPSCHAKVTKGIFSKNFIKDRYKKIRNKNKEEIKPPFDSLDFSDGLAELKLGGISYDPGIKTVLRYHGINLFEICPVDVDGHSGINATFCDDEGRIILEIRENEWVGSVDVFDIVTRGRRIQIRSKYGTYSIALRFDPPRSIVIEKLDMRFRDSHFLVSEVSHAIGRYTIDGDLYWLHVDGVHMGAPLQGAAAIELLLPAEIKLRERVWVGRGQGGSNEDRSVVVQTGLGIAHIPMGVLFGSGCLSFSLGKFAFGGPHSLDKVRDFVFKRPNLLPRFIATGE